MTATKTRILSAVGALATGVALAASPVLAGTASAATDPNALHVTYDVNGSSTVAKTKSTVKLGPAKLSTAINPDGTFTGTLPLPPSSTSFKALGLLPVTATVNFVPAGDITGVLGGAPLQVKSTAKYILRLSNVTVGGLPALVGNSCQTPVVTISANSDPKVNFDILNGGALTGSYTIPNFANCGLTTALINLLVPGPNNTITLNLSNAQFGS